MLVFDGGLHGTGFNPSLDNGTIAFLAFGGVYIATLQGSVTPGALVGMPVPGGTGNFLYFDADSPSQRDGIVAFRGFGPTGQEGIYASPTLDCGGPFMIMTDVSAPATSRLLTGYDEVEASDVAISGQYAYVVGYGFSSNFEVVERAGQSRYGMPE
jgi:hypothetical protein